MLDNIFIKKIKIIDRYRTALHPDSTIKKAIIIFLSTALYIISINDVTFCKQKTKGE